MDAGGLRRRLRGPDLCLPGEGRFDEQSLVGNKLPVVVAQACRELQVTCVVIAGSVELSPSQWRVFGIRDAIALRDLTNSLEQSIRDAPALLAQVSQRVLRTLRCA